MQNVVLIAIDTLRIYHGDLKSRDFKEINLMAANTPHLTKFISSFNPVLVPYYKVEKSRKQE